MVIEHAIRPAVQPAMGIEDSLGVLGITLQCSRIHQNRQIRIAWDDAVVSELKGDGFWHGHKYDSFLNKEMDMFRKVPEG
ncbi:hypothetical protein D3C85_1821270 [compost metagenome]